jgi:bacteriorhodopsin
MTTRARKERTKHRVFKKRLNQTKSVSVRARQRYESFIVVVVVVVILVVRRWYYQKQRERSVDKFLRGGACAFFFPLFDFICFFSFSFQTTAEPGGRSLNSK